MSKDRERPTLEPFPVSTVYSADDGPVDLADLTPELRIRAIKRGFDLDFPEATSITRPSNLEEWVKRWANELWRDYMGQDADWGVAHWTATYILCGIMKIKFQVARRNRAISDREDIIKTLSSGGLKYEREKIEDYEKSINDWKKVRIKKLPGPGGDHLDHPKTGVLVRNTRKLLTEYAGLSKSKTEKLLLKIYRANQFSVSRPQFYELLKVDKVSPQHATI